MVEGCQRFGRIDASGGAWACDGHIQTQGALGCDVMMREGTRGDAERQEASASAHLVSASRRSYSQPSAALAMRCLRSRGSGRSRGMHSIKPTTIEIDGWGRNSIIDWPPRRPESTNGRSASLTLKPCLCPQRSIISYHHTITLQNTRATGIQARNAAQTEPWQRQGQGAGASTSGGVLGLVAGGCG